MLIRMSTATQTPRYPLSASNVMVRRNEKKGSRLASSGMSLFFVSISLVARLCFWGGRARAFGRWALTVLSRRIGWLARSPVWTIDVPWSEHTRRSYSHYKQCLPHLLPQPCPGYLPPCCWRPKESETFWQAAVGNAVGWERRLQGEGIRRQRKSLLRYELVAWQYRWALILL